jgi:hypothetical protein
MNSPSIHVLDRYEPAFSKANFRDPALPYGTVNEEVTVALHSVSALANAGVVSELRQKLSGHADERSHATYTHHELETLRAAVAKLPAMPSA